MSKTDSRREKYRILIDTHCHTYASFHALCSINDVLGIAKKRGLQGVAITDHHPSIDSHSGEDRVRGADFPYFHVFCQRLKNTDPDIVMFKGIELNLLDHEPWVTAASQSYFDRLDFRLAGIHLAEHLFHPSQNVTKNTDAILGAIHSGKSKLFDIMTHPIIFGVPFDHKTVVKAAKERSIALELNNSFFPDEERQHSSRQDIHDLRRFFEVIAMEGALIAVGSDAHVPNEIGDFDSAIDFLIELDFPVNLIVNRNLSTFLASPCIER